MPLPCGDYIIADDKVMDVINRKKERGIPVKKMDFLGTYNVTVDTKNSQEMFVESNMQDSVINVFWLEITKLSYMCWCRMLVDILPEQKTYTIRQLLAWKICISGKIQDCLK